MASVDIFDNNAYAHNPRVDFMNWAAVDAIAFDYPADALGYEEGATIELNQKGWALRYGIFTVPARSNVNATDGHYLKAWDQVLELEERYMYLATQVCFACLATSSGLSDAAARMVP